MNRRALVVVAASLLVAACGSNGAETGAEPTTVTVPATTTAPAPPTTTASTAAPSTLPAPTAPPTTAPTTLPPTTTGPAFEGPVFAIGDSVMLGALPTLEAAVPDITVDAAESRSFRAGAKILVQKAADGTLAPNVVIHLGNNEIVRAEACDDLLGALGDRNVVLVNLHLPRDYEAPNNAELAACAQRNGAALADWHATAAANLDGLYRDRIHLRPPKGPYVYAGLVLGTL